MSQQSAVAALQNDTHPTEGTEPGAEQQAAALDQLDELENIDFLLEEIENKIAPLALA